MQNLRVARRSGARSAGRPLRSRVAARRAPGAASPAVAAWAPPRPPCTRSGKGRASVRSRKSSSPSTSICASFAAQFGSTRPSSAATVSAAAMPCGMRRAAEAHHQQAGLARRLQLGGGGDRRDGAAVGVGEDEVAAGEEQGDRPALGDAHPQAVREILVDLDRGDPGIAPHPRLGVGERQAHQVLPLERRERLADRRRPGRARRALELADVDLAQPEERRGEHPGDHADRQGHQPDGGGERLQERPAGSCGGGAAACRGGGSRAPGRRCRAAAPRRWRRCRSSLIARPLVGQRRGQPVDVARRRG